MDEKIIAQGKKSKKSQKLLTSLCFLELGFAVAILVSAIAFDLLFLIAVAALFLLLGFLLFLGTLASKKVSITVSEYRVYGTYGLLAPTEFELPIDSINSIDSYNNSNGFAIRTSSRAIAFADMENGKEIIKAISNLISDRKKGSNVVNVSSSQSNADELKKYKDLLDSGIITQEEFDAKKKQLLGL